MSDLPKTGRLTELPDTPKPTLRALSSLVATYHQPFQSDYQNDRFVIGQEGVTLWGAFKQCLREVAVRVDEMRLEYVRLNKMGAEAMTKRLHAEKAGEPKVEQRKREQIKSASAQFECANALLEKASADHRMADREREMSHLVNRLFSLHAEIVKVHGEDFDPEVLERLHWLVKISRRALGEKACHGQMSSGTLESILSLPNEDMERTLETIIDCAPKQCFEALMKIERFDLDAMPVESILAPREVRLLLGGEKI